MRAIWVPHRLISRMDNLLDRNHLRDELYVDIADQGSWYFWPTRPTNVWEIIAKLPAYKQNSPVAIFDIPSEKEGSIRRVM